MAERVKDYAIFLLDTEEEKRRAEVTLSTIEDGVISVDVAGRIDYLNEKAQQLAGCEMAAARGQLFCDVFSLLDEGGTLWQQNQLMSALALAGTFDHDAPGVL